MDVVCICYHDVVYMLREGGACHGNGGKFRNKRVSAIETSLFGQFGTLHFGDEVEKTQKKTSKEIEK